MFAKLITPQVLTKGYIKIENQNKEEFLISQQDLARMTYEQALKLMQEKIKQIGLDKELENKNKALTKANIEARLKELAKLKELTKSQLKEKTALESKLKDLILPKLITQSATKTTIKPISMLKTLPINKTGIKPNTNLKLTTLVKAKEIVKPDLKIKSTNKFESPVERPPEIKTDKNKDDGRIFIKLSNGSSTLLDQNKLAGAVGWKQGFVYKAIYKPYKQANLITTKYKIQGIPYYGGVRSAFKSLVQITKGDLPNTIRLTMGIENIIIQTSGDKSIIKFSRNNKANKKALHIKSKHVKNKVNNSSIKEIK